LKVEIPEYHLEQTFPQKPGIYIMKDNQDKIIYIGKAKNLNKRIKSYFSKEHNNSRDKTSILISKIKKIDYVITDNEIEAFLLESNLIKRYRPLFNIELKDQQRYTYLKITDEKFPRLLVTRRNRNGEFMGPKGEIFGPFVKGSSRFLTIGLLRKMFKIRICKQLPKKECLEYHIGNCDAPCINKISQQDYNKNVEIIKNILKTNHDFDEFYSKLEGEMKVASDKKEYEKAIHIRDTLFRLKNLRYHQKIENTFQNNPFEEYIGIIYEKIKNIAYVMTLISKNGVINDMKKYQFDLIADNSFENFISQYYYSNPIIPNTIYLNEEIQEESKLELVLKKISGHNVKIKNIDLITNQTGSQDNKIDRYYNKSNDDDDDDIYKNQSDDDKIKIMDLIISNLKTYIQKNYEPALEELKILLNLKKIPHIIDCFDISNFGNDFAVGACTRFIDGMPFKNGYRRFKIKKIYNQNDFSMMEEIIIRRYKIKDPDNEKDGNYLDTNNVIRNSKDLVEKEEFPDLIIIDGGKGHLNVALKALKKIKLEKIECISLAKGNEEIFTPFLNNSIIIPKNKKSLKILQHIRDESHRFGLTYNRKLRKIMIE
jgi:excinuclease ABC subunit C